MAGISKPARKFLGLLLLCLCATAANKALGFLSVILHTGLFLDTAFIITATFSGGLPAGLLASLFTTVIGGISHYLFWGSPWFWGWYLYGLCFAVTALVTWLFARSFPEECAPLLLFARHNQHEKLSSLNPMPRQSGMLNLIIMLSLLSLALWIIISVMGAFISVFNTRILHSIAEVASVEDAFKLGLLQRGFNLVIAEILARIPINIIDRPVSVLIGYGTSLLLVKAGSRKKQAPLFTTR
ncbi:hypothetical protein AGMMS50230_12820 [Spirochaetia bacterium]|nr:hypothetical protein AGMMS50230_12820 [Spirochaetia bacterium]